MKKLIFVASLFAVVSLSNCKNKAENPVPTTGKAIIKGVATVDLDLTTAGKQGAIPADTKVVVIVSTENLTDSPVGGVTYAKNTYSGVIGAGGVYSIEIDAISKPSSVEVRAESFEATVTFAVTPAPVLSERRRFAPITKTVNVYKGGVFIEDFNY